MRESAYGVPQHGADGLGALDPGPLVEVERTPHKGEGAHLQPKRRVWHKGRQG